MQGKIIIKAYELMKMMKYLAAALLSALMISPTMAQDRCAKKGG